jgi:hypothetical protein
MSRQPRLLYRNEQLGVVHTCCCSNDFQTDLSVDGRNWSLSTRVSTRLFREASAQLSAFFVPSCSSRTTCFQLLTTFVPMVVGVKNTDDLRQRLAQSAGLASIGFVSQTHSMGVCHMTRAEVRRQVSATNDRAYAAEVAQPCTVSTTTLISVFSAPCSHGD